MRYLLGTLSENEKVKLEDDFFSDDEVFEELEIAEEDLIDRYVRDELDAEAHAKFRAKLAQAPRLRERVEFAKLLAARTDAESIARNASYHSQTRESARPRFPFMSEIWRVPSFRWAVATSLLVAVVAISALVWAIKLRNQSIRIEAERLAMERQKRELEQQVTNQQSRNTQLATDLRAERDRTAQQEETIAELQKQLNSQRAGPTIAFLTLFTGSTRSSGSGHSLTIGPHTSQVRLRINFDSDDHASYKVIMHTPEGKVVFEQAGLRSRGQGRRKSIIVQIPASQFRSEQYVVNVEGLTSASPAEAIADYAFEVKRKP